MPNRILRPGLLSSRRVSSVPIQARWVFLGIVLSADDYGRMEYDPLALRSAVFPLELDIAQSLFEEWLAQLVMAELVVLYEVNGHKYLEIPKFNNRPRASKSKYPASEDGQRCATSARICAHLRAYAPETETETVTETVTETTPPPPPAGGETPAASPVAVQTEPEPAKRRRQPAVTEDAALDAFAEGAGLEVIGPWAEPFADWFAHKRSRGPLTLGGWKSLGRKWGPLGYARFKAAVEESTAAGWKGLFEVQRKGVPPPGSNGHHKAPLDNSLHHAMAEEERQAQIDLARLRAERAAQ